MDDAPTDLAVEGSALLLNPFLPELYMLVSGI